MIPLRIVLSGGGTKCAYQLTLLNNLLNNKLFNEKYKIDKIYGTSFGALVGFFLCIEQPEILKKFFLNINKKSLCPWFDLWGYDDYLQKIPIIGNWINNIIKSIIDSIWILISIQKKSLFQPINGFQLLNSITINNIQKNKLNKFYCCVYNITQQKYQYINGNHPLIKDYIIASSSIWLIFAPIKIRQLKLECICDHNCNCFINKIIHPDYFCNCNKEEHQFNEFIDGGLTKLIPMEYDDVFDGLYYVIITKDINEIVNKKFHFNNTGNNLFEYLDKLITFLISNNMAIELNNTTSWYHKMYCRNNIKLINYPAGDDPAILDKNKIQ